MNRRITFVLIISVLFTIPVFAQFDFSESEQQVPEFTSVAYFAVVVPSEEDYEIPHGIINNEFYLESLRLTKLAHDTFEFGDYDASAGFAEEAIRFAQRSDEFVSSQLIGEAKRFLDWADSNNIANRYPSDYNESKSYYEASVAAHDINDWDESIPLAIRSISIMAALEAGRTPPAAALPAQYTVRPWTSTRDCLWNIAGYSWVYGDPWKWGVLYEANKSKLPDPNNPNWIEPGTVLDIPSISGEVRRGMWAD